MANETTRPGKYLRKKAFINYILIPFTIMLTFNLFDSTNWGSIVLMTSLSQYIDPEYAHKLAKIALKYYHFPSFSVYPSETILRISAWGLDFPSPVGIAAGFDKNGEVAQELLDMSFGFVEVGTVTPRPQEGNPKPRLFRIKEKQAIINRMGFNNDGHDVVRKRLLNKIDHIREKGVLGVNIGMNADSKDPISDYVKGVENFADLADYLVLNISSPNTKNLRDLQQASNLVPLLKAVKAAIRDHPTAVKPVLMIKLSPDLSDRDLLEISKIIQHPDTAVDGLVISNTTIDRKVLKTDRYNDVAGGLSGKPLKNLSNEMIKKMYVLTQGKIPIIGSGGVITADDFLEKIMYGASLVQVYTGFTLLGPVLLKKIYQELPFFLAKINATTLSDVIGRNVDLNTPIDQLLDLK